MIKNKYAIEQLVVHRKPMLLIDELVEYDESSAVCRVTISEQSEFFDDAKRSVPNHIGIEYMAQSIAAFAGAKALDQGEQVKVGFLLGSRKLTLNCDAFLEGSVLTVTIAELYQEDNGLSVFQCTISDGDTILAEAKVNTFQPDDASEFVKEQ